MNLANLTVFLLSSGRIISFGPRGMTLERSPDSQPPIWKDDIASWSNKTREANLKYNQTIGKKERASLWHLFLFPSKAMNGKCNTYNFPIHLLNQLPISVSKHFSTLWNSLLNRKTALYANRSQVELDPKMGRWPSMNGVGVYACHPSELCRQSFSRYLPVFSFSQSTPVPAPHHTNSSKSSYTIIFWIEGIVWKKCIWSAVFEIKWRYDPGTCRTISATVSWTWKIQVT